MERETGTFRVKSGLAEMLKGGVIMDVINAEQAQDRRGRRRVRRDGARARPGRHPRATAASRAWPTPTKIEEIQEAVSIPVMAKARIGHFVEAQILQALGVDYIDESEVLTPADEEHHIDKWAFTVPVRLRRREPRRGAPPDRRGRGDDPHEGRGRHRQRRRGRPPHARRCSREIALAARRLRPEQLVAAAKELGAPVELVRMVAETGRLPVVNFAAGGHRDAGRRGAR